MTSSGYAFTRPVPDRSVARVGRGEHLVSREEIDSMVADGDGWGTSLVNIVGHVAFGGTMAYTGGNGHWLSSNEAAAVTLHFLRHDIVDMDVFTDSTGGFDVAKVFVLNPDRARAWWDEHRGTEPWRSLSNALADGGVVCTALLHLPATRLDLTPVTPADAAVVGCRCLEALQLGLEATQQHDGGTGSHQKRHDIHYTGLCCATGEKPHSFDPGPARGCPGYAAVVAGVLQTVCWLAAAEGTGAPAVIDGAIIFDGKRGLPENPSAQEQSIHDGARVVAALLEHTVTRPVDGAVPDPEPTLAPRTNHLSPDQISTRNK
ncbi:hypothetical protein T484DRAFT_1749562 [Baffinella frigidus]|nr:hypothetical protein T484DRAFT_1749562 [Cryptophyta sp. CCMP2293]